MIDPKNTSFYNHDKIGDKPVIPNRVYKELLEQIERGDLNLYNDYIEQYAFVPEQISLIEMKIRKNSL